MQAGTVVFGTVFMDCKGFAANRYDPLGRNVGTVRFIHGGVGRNVAENLALAGSSPVFVSSVDEGGLGGEVLARLAAEGVDVSRVRRAPEYSGLILDLLADHYDARNHILSGSGYNCGVELMVAKLSGRLTGWVSYAWGAARRRFSGTADRRLTDAVTSPDHVFSLFTRLALTPRLDAGAVFNLRSGRPTTPVRAIYMVGQNVLTEYGRRNSVRLPLYHRLDLFLNYRFAPRRASGLRHALALSVLNAYGRNNPEIRSYRYDPEHNTYRLHEVSSLYRFMPSLSYTLTF